MNSPPNQYINDNSEDNDAHGCWNGNHHHMTVLTRDGESCEVEEKQYKNKHYHHDWLQDSGYKFILHTDFIWVVFTWGGKKKLSESLLRKFTEFQMKKTHLSYILPNFSLMYYAFTINYFVFTSSILLAFLHMKYEDSGHFYVCPYWYETQWINQKLLATHSESVVSSKKPDELGKNLHLNQMYLFSDKGKFHLQQYE